LVADIDTYFTYVTDGKRRAQSQPGGDLDIRMGDARLRLKDDTDRKDALLLVGAFSSDSIPVHLLTKEAGQLYFDRMTEARLFARHISNRWVRLEPVVAAIARELGVTARVWNDDAEKRPGKTASSWVVLARKPEYLGSLYSPLGDLLFGPPVESGDDRPEMSMDAQLWQGVATLYAEELAAPGTGGRKKKYQEMNEAEDPGREWLDWALRKYADLCDPDGTQRLRAINEALVKNGF